MKSENARQSYGCGGDERAVCMGICMHAPPRLCRACIFVMEKKAYENRENRRVTHKICVTPFYRGCMHGTFFPHDKKTGPEFGSGLF